MGRSRHCTSEIAAIIGGIAVENHEYSIAPPATVLECGHRVPVKGNSCEQNCHTLPMYVWIFISQTWIQQLYSDNENY